MTDEGRRAVAAKVDGGVHAMGSWTTMNLEEVLKTNAPASVGALPRRRLDSGAEVSCTWPTRAVPTARVGLTQGPRIAWQSCLARRAARGRRARDTSQSAVDRRRSGLPGDLGHMLARAL
ncbi:hypothetical protein GCM10020219_024530 [Nonomuraea dietziae]